MSTQNFKPENDQRDCSLRNERSMRNNQTRNRPSHNHDSAAPRHHLIICTSAGLIHPVHGQPMSLATKAIPRNEVTFSPFSRAFSTILTKLHKLSTWHSCAHQDWRNCTTITTNLSIPYFLVVLGSESTITEITEYMYFSLL